MKIHLSYIILITIILISCKGEKSSNLSNHLKNELIAVANDNHFKKDLELSQHSTMTFEHNGKSKIGEINDPDGYTNLRSKKSSQSQIITRVTQHQYFFYLPSTTENWYKVKDLNGNIGFIHKSRISEVSDKKLYNISFTHQTTEKDFRKDSIVHYNDLEKVFKHLWEIEFNYTSSLSGSKKGNEIIFNGENIKVTFIQEKTNPDVSLSLEETWGTESGNPKYQYKSIDIIENGKAYSIPKSQFSDLYEPTLDEGYIDIFTDINNQTILKVSNSDGAGSYIAVFFIEQQEVVKRIVYTPF